MPQIFGSIDVNDTWFTRVRLNNTRSASATVGPGVSFIAWQLDDASFSNPAESFRLELEESLDGGVSWQPTLSATYVGGAKGKDGSPPAGYVDVAPGVTNVRARLVPVAGRPTVGLYGTVR